MRGSLCTWPTPGPGLPAKSSRQRTSSIPTWPGHAPLEQEDGQHCATQTSHSFLKMFNARLQQALVEQLFYNRQKASVKFLPVNNSVNMQTDRSGLVGCDISGHMLVLVSEDTLTV